MIVPMTSDHVSQVVEIERALFSSPWKEQDFLFEIENNPFSHYYVYLLDNQVVGFIGSWISEDQGEITNVGVHPDYQGNHYGDALLKFALDQPLSVCTLEVRKSNYKAISLYEKYGFKKAAIRKNYYSDPDEDGILMVKEYK